MKQSPSPWERLASAARDAADDRELTAPFGFSTRVAAQALSTPPVPLLMQKLSLRALGVGVSLMLVTIAANAGPILSTLQEEADALSETAVPTEPLDLS